MEDIKWYHLVVEIYESHKKMMYNADAFLVFGGIVDVVSGKILPLNEQKCDRESFDQAFNFLMEAYKKAPYIIGLCDLYKKYFPNGTQNEILNKGIDASLDSIINGCNIVIKEGDHLLGIVLERFHEKPKPKEGILTGGYNSLKNLYHTLKERNL